MEYTVDEIRQFTAEEDVKFLRLAFCDIFGSQKNISILPDELDRAFRDGGALGVAPVPRGGGAGPPARVRAPPRRGAPPGTLAPAKAHPRSKLCQQSCTKI